MHGKANFKTQVYWLKLKYIPLDISKDNYDINIRYIILYTKHKQPYVENQYETLIIRRVNLENYNGIIENIEPIII